MADEPKKTLTDSKSEKEAAEGDSLAKESTAENKSEDATPSGEGSDSPETPSAAVETVARGDGGKPDAPDGGEPVGAKEPNDVSGDGGEPVADEKPTVDVFAGIVRTELDARVLPIRKTITALLNNLSEMSNHCDIVDRIIPKQYDELQTLRGDWEGRLINPILRGIIGVIDSITDTRTRWDKKPPEKWEDECKKLLDFIVDSLGVILSDRGFKKISANEGDPFDPRRHSSTGGKIKTDDPDKNMRVAEAPFPGYVSDTEEGKVLRPVKVRTYVYEAPKESPEKPSENPETKNGASEQSCV
jgi:molecular chaperone GrpE (heat shock protein)